MIRINDEYIAQPLDVVSSDVVCFICQFNTLTWKFRCQQWRILSWSHRFTIALYTSSCSM